MLKKTTLRGRLDANEYVVAPCVYDCASARAVELSGYKAMMLSGAELSMSMKGMPDLGLLTLDELLWAVTRITDVSPLPLAVDIGDGFGGPLNVFHTCERMAKAGAAAVLMEDEAAPGFAREVVDDHLLPRKDFLANVKAALSALEGSDCFLIARTNVSTETELEEGIARCLGALELGAPMTLIVRLNSVRDAREIARRVPGWKMYPDLNQNMNVPEVAIDEIAPLGFNFITMHYLMKGAMAGMLDYGDHNFAANDNHYSNHQKPRGVAGQSAMAFFAPQRWLDFEAGFTGKPMKFKGPSLEGPAGAKK